MQANFSSIDVLHFELVNAGFYSGAPYLAMAILLIASGSVVDIVLKKGWMGATTVIIEKLRI